MRLCDFPLCVSDFSFHFCSFLTRIQCCSQLLRAHFCLWVCPPCGVLFSSSVWLTFSSLFSFSFLYFFPLIPFNTSSLPLLVRLILTTLFNTQTSPFIALFFVSYRILNLLYLTVVGFFPGKIKAPQGQGFWSLLAHRYISNTYLSAWHMVDVHYSFVEWADMPCISLKGGCPSQTSPTPVHGMKMLFRAEHISSL